jgi:signal transduction histidine kinase
MTRLAACGVIVHRMATLAPSSFPRRWRSREDAPLIVDAVVAVVLLAGSLAALAALNRDAAPVLGAACCVVCAGAVALRRRMPMLAAAAALAGLAGYELATRDPNCAFPPVAVVLTFYLLGRSAATRRDQLHQVPVVGVALASCVIISVALNASPAKAVAAWLATAVVTLLAGMQLARRSVLNQQLARVAAQLRAAQDLNAAQATAEERNRVARDLHDVVAHCVSVMVVQAGAARLIAAHSRADADNALAVIGRCGRDALADLRRIVGVLHRDADPDFGCGAALADLGRLAERVQAAGVSTHLDVEGDPKLPAAVDAVAYRVVQEALTNVVKHAGDGAAAHVQVIVGPAAVTVEITNTIGGAHHQVSQSGQGLRGMSERVRACGGELRAGPSHDGGYAVWAQIPLEATRTGPSDASIRPPHWAKRLRLRTPSWLGESVVVVAWLVAMEAEAATSAARRGPWIFNAAAVAVMALAAFWRRRSPLLFLAVVGGLAVPLGSGLTALDRSTITGMYTLVVPLFTVAAWESRTRAVIGMVGWATGAGVIAAARHTTVAAAGAVAMGLVVWTAGRVWRAQRTLTVELTETTAQLAAERDQRAQLAIATERTRIARELHGEVAHGVVTMVVQAEAARNLLLHDPGNAEAGIRAIEQTGRDALTQLRRILGVLRSTDNPPPRWTAPLPLPATALPTTPSLCAKVLT